MIYALLKTVHLLSLMVWVGGMVFTLFFLRPAVAGLPAPERLTLMHAVLGRFFKGVLWASTLAVFSGFWMMGRVAKATVQSGGSFVMPLEWLVMAGVGVLMLALFLHIRFALFKRLGRAVAASDWEAGGAALAAIRLWVSVNLGLGVAVVTLVYMGVSS